MFLRLWIRYYYNMVSNVFKTIWIDFDVLKLVSKRKQCFKIKLPAILELSNQIICKQTPFWLMVWPNIFWLLNLLSSNKMCMQTLNEILLIIYQLPWTNLIHLWILPFFVCGNEHRALGKLILIDGSLQMKDFWQDRGTYWRT